MAYKLISRKEITPSVRIEIYESDEHTNPIIKVIADDKAVVYRAGHDGGEDVGLEELTMDEFSEALISTQ